MSTHPEGVSTWGLRGACGPFDPRSAQDNMRLAADHPAALTRSNSIVYSARVPKTIAAVWDGEAARAGMSRSDWLRQTVDPERARVTGARQPGRPHRTADPALLFQIAKAGTLLNQLAHQANAAAIAGSKADVLQTLLQIERHLDELLRREGAC